MTEIEFQQAVCQMFAKMVGCAMASYNYWHEDVDELVYEAGLYMELADAGFDVKRQEEFPIYYKGRPTPVKRKMDIMARHPSLGYVVVELKAINYIGDEQRRQLWSYMKLTNTRFGFLVNFSPKGIYSENWELDEQTGKCHRV